MRKSCSLLPAHVHGKTNSPNILLLAKELHPSIYTKHFDSVKFREQTWFSHQITIWPLRTNINRLKVHNDKTQQIAIFTINSIESNVPYL